MPVVHIGSGLIVPPPLVGSPFPPLRSYTTSDRLTLGPDIKRLA